MSGVTLPKTLTPPKPRGAWIVERAGNGGYAIRDTQTQALFVFADIDGLLRSLPTIVGDI